MTQVAVSVTGSSGEPVAPARRPRRSGCCCCCRRPDAARKAGCRPPPWRSSLLIAAIIATVLAVCVLVPLTLDEGVRPLFSGSYAPATCHVASVAATNGTCSCRLCQAESRSCLAFTAHVSYASHLMLRRRSGWDVEHALLTAGSERCHAWLACEHFLRETALLGSNLSCLVREDERGALAVPRQQHGRAAWLFLLLLLPLLVLAALLAALYCQLCGPPARRRRAVRAWRRAAAQVRQRQRSFGRQGGAPTPEDPPPPPPSLLPLATRPTLMGGSSVGLVAKRE